MDPHFFGFFQLFGFCFLIPGLKEACNLSSRQIWRLQNTVMSTWNSPRNERQVDGIEVSLLEVYTAGPKTSYFSIAWNNSIKKGVKQRQLQIYFLAIYRG